MDNKLTSHVKFGFIILIFILTLKSSIFAQKQLCAVMDLTSDRSVSKKSCSLISNYINKALLSDGRYTLFDRKVLPELLKQLLIYETSRDCSDQQCLEVTGSLIGTDFIIGGTARYRNRTIEITLNMVDVNQNQTVHSITMSSGSGRTTFLNKDIPELVNSLLNFETLSRPNVGQRAKTKIGNRRTGILEKPGLYAGSILAGGVALGVYYVIQNNKKELSETYENLPLSLDDVPQRTRGAE